MILLGTIANALAVLLGGTIGAIAKKGIPQRFGDLIIQALAIFTLAIGVLFTMKSENIIIVVISLVIGAVLGELIQIEERLENFGKHVQEKFKGFKGNFSEAFVTTSLFTCVGSMAIMGSLQSGLSNNHEILFTKSIMDLIVALIFSSTLGIGVAFASIPIFLYQGAITILASSIAPYLSNAVIGEMTATGGILLIGLALSILEIKKVKVANLLPAIFLPIIIMALM